MLSERPITACLTRRMAYALFRSLEWLATLPPGTSSWRYFCRRMALRRRLRCQLSSLARFLDPLSAAAIQPPAAVEQIREVERALQVGMAAHGWRMPWFSQVLCATGTKDHIHPIPPPSIVCATRPLSTGPPALGAV